MQHSFADADASPIQILLAEDDEDHVLLLKRALRYYPRPVHVEVARDGQEAVDMLRDPSRSARGLILLDINMPRMGGIEVLRVVKSDARLTLVPTVMLTTSARDEDRAASFRAGADEYLTKPVNFERFSHSLFALVNRLVARHWAQGQWGAPGVVSGQRGEGQGCLRAISTSPSASASICSSTSARP